MFDCRYSIVIVGGIPSSVFVCARAELQVILDSRDLRMSTRADVKVSFDTSVLFR